MLSGKRFEPQLLSVFRIVAGFLFLQHGLQKILGMLGGVAGTGATARPLTLYWFAGMLELIGGDRKSVV